MRTSQEETCAIFISLIYGMNVNINNSATPTVIEEQLL